MFTGLVEELAHVESIRQGASDSSLTLRARRIMDDMQLGDSIAVNGICLTVVERTETTFSVDAVPETMRRTNLGLLRRGDTVHVERAMPMNGRFGGHIVSGHIDGTGRVAAVDREGTARVLRIQVAPELLRYLVEKGSICVDGVSLTVMDVSGDVFRVSIIPHTEGVTRLGHAQVGDVVNLEMDVIAKYVERLLQFGPATAHHTETPSMSMAFLTKYGFA